MSKTKKYYIISVNNYLYARLLKVINENDHLCDIIRTILADYAKREYNFTPRRTMRYKKTSYMAQHIGIPIDLGNLLNNKKDNDESFSRFCNKILAKELFNEEKELPNYYHGKQKIYNFKIKTELKKKMDELKINRTHLKGIMIRYLEYKYGFRYNSYNERPPKNYVSDYVSFPSQIGRFIDQIKDNEPFYTYCNTVLYKILCKYQKRKNLDKIKSSAEK